MMHFKVVFRVAKALQAAGCAVLRFNFRGVGRSEGTFDDGRGEQDDARAALDEVERRFSELPLMVGGFSFGSVVALHVGRQDERRLDEVQAAVEGWAEGRPWETQREEGDV